MKEKDLKKAVQSISIKPENQDRILEKIFLFRKRKKGKKEND